MITNSKGDKGPGRWLHVFNLLVSIQWISNKIRRMLVMIKNRVEDTILLKSSDLLVSFL